MFSTLNVHTANALNISLIPGSKMKPFVWMLFWENPVWRSNDLKKIVDDTIKVPETQAELVSAISHGQTPNSVLPKERNE